MLSLGSYLYHVFTVSNGWTSQAGITGVLFVILVPLCLVISDVYSRIIDDASLFFARWMFKWIRE